MGGRSGKNTYEYSVSTEEGKSMFDSQIYRCLETPSTYIDPSLLTSTTLYSLFSASVSYFSTRPFLGTRESLINGEFDRYRWRSYGQVQEEVKHLADSLREVLDLRPDMVMTFGIYCNPRSEWVIIDLACLSQSVATVVLFDSLGFESIAEVINATMMTGMALSGINKSTIFHLKREGKIPALVHLVQFEDVVTSERVEAGKLGLNLLSFRELIKAGTGTGPKRVPSPDTIYSICYTSGTCGTPTGIVITHKHISSMILSVTKAFSFSQEDVYFSYLPQAHIQERSLIYVMMSVGASIGFCAGDISHMRDDMIKLKPTLFAAVPRILYKLAEHIRSEVSRLSKYKQNLFKRALKSKQTDYHSSGKLKSRIWDTIVMRPIRASFGGRIRILVVGGATMNSEELEFMRLVLSVPIIEGYGLTESCACSLVTDPTDSELGHVGGPLPMLEVKLENPIVLESGEVSGELCLRGPQVAEERFSGLQEDGRLERKLTDPEGWLHTGDIALRTAHNGGFRIVDRLKNIFKLSHGEYITPEKIENSYKCACIDVIVVYGNPLKSYLVALVVPNERKLRAKWCPAHQVSLEVSWEELCSHEEVRKYLFGKIAARSVKYRLPVYEQVMNLLVLPTIDSELFTNTGKLKRYQALKRFETKLEELYEVAPGQETS